jgi:nucleoside-diphosphate-sugar epimerase
MIFVTGGTGLIGSHLLVELSTSNSSITAIYRNKNKLARVKQLFCYYFGGEKGSENFEKITWKPCDLLDVVTLEELLKGHEYVYHCAAIVSFAKRDFKKMYAINCEGTANVVNTCLAVGIKKLCHVSSTAAVGKKDIAEGEYIQEDANWEKTDETSGYSITKHRAEMEVWRGVEEGLPAVIINPSIVFGAGNWEESSLVLFRTIEKGLLFYSPGSNSFVDARDVATQMARLMNSGIVNERFLCIGHNTSFKTVFDTIAHNLKKKPPKYKVNPLLMGIAWRLATFWAGITFSRPTITKASAKSAFSKQKYTREKLDKVLPHPYYSLEESIQNTIQGRILE